VLSGLRSERGRRVSSGSAYSTVLLSRAIRGCASHRAARVLDVGCGESPYRDVLSPDLYVGVDRTPRLAPGELGAMGDATALPVADRSFDGVLCTEVIEHVLDERLLARELARVARTDAVLVLSSPFVHGLHEQPYDFRRLTSIGLCRVLDENGWHVERVSCVGGPAVVALDSAVRWSDSTLRRLAARLFGGASLPVRAVTAASRGVQELLAGLTLVLPFSRLGEIDPEKPSPRLTLGYVVVARRRP
jgi:SAM-dependent methyltransferase